MTTRNQATGKPLRISVADLQARLQAGEAASMFDVRNQSEWDRSDRKMPGGSAQAGRSGSIRPGPRTGCWSPTELDRRKRPAPWRVQLREQGFTEGYALLGGFDAWQSAGYPVEPKVP